MTNYTNQLKEQLKEKGYRLTDQRMAILDTILNNRGKHLNSQEIYELVKDEHPEIGVATVYRTLPLLEEIGIVYGADFGDGSIKYEVAKEHEVHRHHHLICVNCGSIEEFEDDLLETIEAEIYKKKNFEITDHRVKFFGYCKECIAKREKSAKNNEK